MANSARRAAPAEQPVPAAAPSGPRRPQTELLAFIEQFRASHDLAALDAPGFAEGLRDPSPGPDVAL